MEGQKKQIFSGIQPTGEVHFGNYFGAIQNWVNCQSQYNCVFSVVDYHAITMPYQAAKLREVAWDLVFNLLAMGVKAENLFIQSMIPEHAELCWLLNCFCSYGELTRMTQFKDKSDLIKEKDKSSFVSAGLFGYPVLQAADILIYKADFVPVGKDQEQHLELSRNIAERFNAFVGKDYFPIPECLFAETPKIMSLADPTKKMSKSLGERHYVSVMEEAASVQKKVRSAVTDTGAAPQEGMSAGVENLFTLLKAAGAMDAHQQFMADYQAGQLRYAPLKEAVGTVLSSLTEQFRAKKAEISSDKRAVKQQIKASAEVIRGRAKQTLREVKDLLGLQGSV